MTIPALTCRRVQGFSLLEVLVALVIISIGAIGVAAMQASALSSTHSSQNESLIAVQARSLADAMIANPAYWNVTTGGPPAQFEVDAPAGSSSTPTISDATLATTAACLNATCNTPSQVAAYDVQQWGKQLIPQSKAIVSCQPGSPVICTIQMIWIQKSSTAISNATTNTGAAPDQTMTYTLVNQS